MAGWQRWLVLGIIGVGLSGCGDDSSKGGGNAGGGNAQGGGQVAGPPAGLAPPGLATGDAGSAAGRGGGTPAPVAASAPAPSASSAPSSGSQTGLQDLLQYIPENLRVAAGANFGLLADKAHPIGPRVFTQLRPALTILAVAGFQRDQLEGLWVGHTSEVSDLVICARTKGNYDSGSVTKALSAVTPGEKIGKAQVFALPEAPQKNAVACVDSRTILIGRADTVAAALKAPAAGPVRNGLRALNTPDVHYWVAGDDAYAHDWFVQPEIELLESLFGERIKTQGVAIGFGGSVAVSEAVIAARSMSRRGGGDPEDDQQDNFLALRAGRGAAAARPGAPPAAKGVDLAVGICFATDGVAATVEGRLTALKAGPGGAAPEGASAAAGRGGRNGGADEEQQQDDFQAARAGAGRGGRGGRGGGARGGRGGGAGAGADAAAGAAVRPPPIQINSAREKENLRLTMSVPADGPFLAAFINDAVNAEAPSVVPDGVSPGMSLILSLGLQQWQSKPGAFKGVRRVEGMRPAAGYSFLTELLPFVGYPDVYSAFDFSRDWTTRENRPHAMVAIPAFLNSADPRMHWSGLPMEKYGLGLTHFVGMSGIEDRPDVIAAELPRSDPRAGVFGYDEVVKSSEITDGAGQTIMMIGAGNVVGPWVQGGGATIRGARAPYFDELRGFGSKGLPGPGAYVLMADGSVRLIAGNIDPEVFKALCTVRGAEKIDMSKFVTQGQD